MQPPVGQTVKATIGGVKLCTYVHNGKKIMKIFLLREKLLLLFECLLIRNYK